MFDVEKVKFISVSEVPPKKNGRYALLFDKIPEGKAAVIESDGTFRFYTCVFQAAKRYGGLKVTKSGNFIYVSKPVKSKEVGA